MTSTFSRFFVAFRRVLRARLKAGESTDMLMSWRTLLRASEFWSTSWVWSITTLIIRKRRVSLAIYIFSEGLGCEIQVFPVERTTRQTAGDCIGGKALTLATISFRTLGLKTVSATRVAPPPGMISISTIPFNMLSNSVGSCRRFPETLTSVFPASPADPRAVNPPGISGDSPPDTSMILQRYRQISGRRGSMSSKFISENLERIREM
mmetsp:Transcript_1083/g.1512  ORF Transcript_1083/g.1512 Transcript_1083/m.1512 type:complete len:208 (+) Transcript_1083:156-779(+)